MGSDARDRPGACSRRLNELSFSIIESLPLDSVIHPKHLTGQYIIQYVRAKIVCINRGGEIIIPTGKDCIELNDSVVIVTKHKGLFDLKDILK